MSAPIANAVFWRTHARFDAIIFYPNLEELGAPAFL
jgi:hypothetical protein